MSAKRLMQQTEIDANREHWKQVRRSGVSASEIAAVMGLSPKNHESAFSLFTQKQTGEDMGTDSDEMLRGRVLEPYVAEAFEAAHPYLELHPGGLYASEERPWQMATFDRLAVDLSELGERPFSLRAARAAETCSMPVEIKTSVPNDDFGEPGSAQLPVHIRAQAMWQMDVWQSEVVWVPVQFMMPWRLTVYLVERTDEVESDLALMREEAESFLDRLVRDDPPAVDWRPATTRALKSLHPTLEERSVQIPVKLSRRYKAARAAKARAEMRQAQATNEILARMGAARYAVTMDGNREVKVVTRTQSKRPYYPAGVLRDKYPDIAAAIEQETPVDSVSPGGWAR